MVNLISGKSIYDVSVWLPNATGDYKMHFLVEAESKEDAEWRAIQLWKEYIGSKVDTFAEVRTLEKA